MAKTFYIVDDHELLRIGTISFIEKKSDWICKGNASTPESALSDLALLSGGNILPDLVISDLNFSGDDAGFDFIAKLHSLYPELKIIVYSMFFFGRNGSDGNSKRRGGLYFKKCAVGRAYRMHGKRF